MGKSGTSIFSTKYSLSCALFAWIPKTCFALLAELNFQFPQVFVFTRPRVATRPGFVPCGSASQQDHSWDAKCPGFQGTLVTKQR